MVNIKEFAVVVAHFIPLVLGLQTSTPCQLRAFERGYVCVNNETYCDTLDVEMPNDYEYVLVTSSSGGDRFSYKKVNFAEQPTPIDDRIARLDIDSTKTYQTMRGFGAGYPGAETFLMNLISPNMRHCLYKSYFSSDVGMHYTHLRFSIGGTDFEYYGPWAYNSYPENDTQLTNFTRLDDRELMRNQQFKELKEISKNDDIKILSAAWSPPLWMKQNRQWIGLKNNQILTKYFQTWANYHVRWLELMKADGVDVWAMSPGNEPSLSGINNRFESTYWNASLHGQWIANYFGPAIRNSNFSDLIIHGFDDSRGFVLEYLDEIRKSNPKALDYFSTISHHGYTDNSTSPTILDTVQSEHPDKEIWYTETSYGVEFLSKDPGPQLGFWERAEELTNMLMSNFNHSTVAYIDWNFVLNSTGGPNYVAGTTDAPVILSADFKEMYKQPMFYVMAHFSKFIPPGSVRIDARQSGNQCQNLTTLAFQQPDNTISVILYNNNTQNSIDLIVQDRSKDAFNITLKPKSINTLLYTSGKSNDTKTDEKPFSKMKIAMTVRN